MAYLSILRMGNQSVTTNPNSNNSSSKIKTAMTEESQFLNYQSIRFVEDSNPPILQQQRCLQGKLDDWISKTQCATLTRKQNNF